MGRDSAFAAVALPHLDAAFNLARWLTGSTQEAEDVVQEAMVRALTYFPSFRGGNARAWILQIVRNAAYAAKSAVAAVKDVTEGWIPMRSWVRYMSGAEAHSSAVQSAIAAGEARRAFLKGIAQSKGCVGIGPRRMTPYPAPPLTPSSVAQ